jgi:hypothetical protein
MEFSESIKKGIKGHYKKAAMHKADMKQKPKVLTTTQVIGCRVSKDQWHQLEQKCLANQIPMSRILKQAVTTYLTN